MTEKGADVVVAADAIGKTVLAALSSPCLSGSPRTASPVFPVISTDRESV